MGIRSDGVRKEKRDNRFHWIIDFRYRDKDGRERRYRRDASVQTSAGAHAEAQRLRQRAAETGTLDEGPNGNITFGEFVEQTFRPLYMATKCRPSTRGRYNDLLRQGVLDEFRARRLDDEWAVPITAFAAKLATRGVQHRPHVALVRTILRAAVEFRALARLPDMPRLPKPGRKLPAAPSDDDVSRLLAGASGWLHTGIALAVYAGLRMGEIRALEVRDVDFVHGRIQVRRALSADEVLSPKSGNDRVVPLATRLRATLEPLLHGKSGSARVLQNRKGKTPGRQHVLTALKRLEQKTGVPPWSFHALRHYFCTTLLNRGAHVEAVRVLAGHSSLEITERYLHAAAADLREAIGRLNEMRTTAPETAPPPPAA